MPVHFRISTDVEAPGDVSGAFADLAEVAFNVGLPKREQLIEESNPYILFTMMVAVIGRLGQKFLEMTYVSQVADEDSKAIQSEVYDAAIDVLAFAMIILYKMRGTIENEN